nr:hypothetical protein [Tanacetum cinerariifolium]
MDQQNLTLAKIPILDTGKFEQSQFRIQQYLQHEHYALWEVIEFRDSYEVPASVATIETSSDGTEQTFNRLQVIVGQLQFMDVEIEQDDLNQKFLTSLAPEWLMHTIVWRNRSDLHTMSLDDLYNHLKVYESEVQKKSEPNSHNMAFISSAKHSRGNEDVNTDIVSTVSTNVPTACANIRDWSYMANDEENHALVADEEAPTEFTLMANTSAESKELETLKKEKEGLDGKLAGFLTASKDLDNLIESQRSDKKKDGLGYSVVPPPPAQIYSSPMKDSSWTGLPEFKDDTITDYSRPAHTVKSSPDDAQNRNPLVTEEASPSTITPKSFIKFVKANDSPTNSKTDKAETPKKPPVKSQNNTHKSFTPRPVVHKPYRPPIRPMRSNMNGARPNRISFNKPAHSYSNRPFQRTSAVRSQYRAPWVPTVNINFPPVNRKFSTVSGNFSTVNRKFPTANRTFPTGCIKFHTADMRKKEKAVKPSACWFWKPLQNLSNKGPNNNSVSVMFKSIHTLIHKADSSYWDSGCSRHMIGNISYLSGYEPFDGGYVSFGQGGCKITGKGTIKNDKLKFENVYFMKDLKYNLFSVSQICDNKNSVLFTDSECIVLGQNFKLSDNDNVLFRTPRQHNMYSIDLNNIVLHKDLTCLVAKAVADECMLWHRRLGHLNFKTMNKLVRHNLVRGLPTKCFENDHTCTACLKGKQHKASCIKDAASQEVKKDVSFLRYIALPNWVHDALLESSSSKPQDDCSYDVLESSRNTNSTATLTNPPADQLETLTVETPIPTVSSPVPTDCFTDSLKPSSDARLISKRVDNQVETPSLDNILTLANRFEDILGVTTNSDESNGVEADVLKNKKDERGIVIRNKAMLVVQGYTQEEGFDYDEVFVPVSRIEAIILFLAYASFMGFIVYQMYIKSAILYGTIDEEVYMMQPLGFQDPDIPTKVYKVEKAMYGLHQAPRAWYGTLSKYLLTNGFQRGTINQTLFIRRQRGDFILVQKKDGIFLSQDKYVGDILKKFGYSDVRSLNTPMDKENPWGTDGTGKDIDLHLYRSMIGSLMYLTASRPEIMFAEGHWERNCLVYLAKLMKKKKKTGGQNVASTSS